MSYRQGRRHTPPGQRAGRRSGGRSPERWTPGDEQGIRGQGREERRGQGRERRRGQGLEETGSGTGGDTESGTAGGTGSGTGGGTGTAGGTASGTGGQVPDGRGPSPPHLGDVPLDLGDPWEGGHGLEVHRHDLHLLLPLLLLLHLLIPRLPFLVLACSG